MYAIRSYYAYRVRKENIDISTGRNKQLVEEHQNRKSGLVKKIQDRQETRERLLEEKKKNEENLIQIKEKIKEDRERLREFFEKRKEKIESIHKSRDKIDENSVITSYSIHYTKLYDVIAHDYYEIKVRRYFFEIVEFPVSVVFLYWWVCGKCNKFPGG